MRWYFGLDEEDGLRDDMSLDYPIFTGLLSSWNLIAKYPSVLNIIRVMITPMFAIGLPHGSDWIWLMLIFPVILLALFLGIYFAIKLAIKHADRDKTK
ncbi:MAG: hypothetical protein LBK76_03035 [Verrucomicrobiales bacterium]|jgi:hypothetical protein|nr:hypothetical protein [Verrucomicrobiales bacterium]